MIASSSSASYSAQRSSYSSRTASSSAAFGASGGPAVSGGARLNRSLAMSAVAPGVSCQIAHSGVKNIVAGRSREKSDMQELNQRFASYIEKVRLLESQNQQLVQSLASARESSGIEVLAIKESYETDLTELRTVLDESERQKAEIEVRITSLEDRIADMDILITDYREQDGVDLETVTRLNHMVIEYETEISMLRARVVKFDEERARDQAEMDRLKIEIDRLRTDLDAETLVHIQTEGESQTLREELEFTKQVYDAELKELAAVAYRDTTVEVRDFWKGELAQAIQDLRLEYESRIEVAKTELDTIYTAKVEEVTTQTSSTSIEVTQVKEESERVKTELVTLRENLPVLEERHVELEKKITEVTTEIEEIRRTQEIDRLSITKEVNEARYELAMVLEELQTLLDAKLSLELEIAAYRKLLEYEESRVVAVTSGGGGGGGVGGGFGSGGGSGGGVSFGSGGGSGGGGGFGSGGGSGGGGGAGSAGRGRGGGRGGGGGGGGGSGAGGSASMASGRSSSASAASGSGSASSSRASARR